jgi:hypothetical protein
MRAVPRNFRQFKRSVRALQLESWVLAALVLFVSTEFLLQIPGMVAGPSLQTHQHQQQSSGDHKPVSHEHNSCQLCMAPPLALAVSSLSQLGKTRLVILDSVLLELPELGKQEHRIGLRSRAPPILVPSV